MEVSNSAKTDVQHFFEADPPKSYISTAKIEPVHADISFSFDTSGDFLLHGVMDLDLKILQNLDRFSLHQALLQIEGCSVFSQGRTLSCSFQKNDADQTVDFVPQENLDQGKATLHVRWTVNVSRLPEPTAGKRFWKGLLSQKHGTEGGFHMITQFEPCNSRYAFPFFDQPCTRATFRLSFENVPSFLTILSNTEMASEENHGKTKRVVFKPTRPTPAYLIAWTVGDFDRIERTITLPSYNQDVSLRASARLQQLTVRAFILKETKAKGADAEYALDLVCDAMNFFTREFQVNYPFPKLDNVSTPLHPLLGMENWGLITYSEGFFDIVPATTLGNRRKRIARLIAHEVVHQWFGNSVTVAWWSGLYLKEGFARLLEYVFIESRFPEWDFWKHFQMEIYGSVLERDEDFETTHPIERPINVPDEIYSNVDIICYAKGACVLRQLWSYLGRKVFFSALRIYQNRYRDEAVMPKHLWQTMKEASAEGLDIEQLMDTWVTKSGHPFLSVTRSSSGRYLLEQRLCVKRDGKVGARIETDEEGLSLFSIPIVARTPDDKQHRILMAKGSLRCTEFDEFDFVVFNHKSFGFYRVLYDEQLLSHVYSEKSFVLEEELCSILCDTLFFFCSDIPHNRPSAVTLVHLIKFSLETVRSQYLWALMIPPLLVLLKHLELSDFYGHVLTALRDPLNVFYEKVRADAEFSDRGTLDVLELLLAQVCAPLDPFALIFTTACDDALFRLEHEAPSGGELARLLKPIELCCRSPATGESASRDVMALIEQKKDISPELRRVLIVLIARNSSNNSCVESAISLLTDEEVFALLDRNRSNIRLATAVAKLKGTEGAAALAREILERDSLGRRLRKDFASFTWRKRASTIPISKERSFNHSNRKDRDSFLPLTQYLMLGAMALGAVALGTGAWMLLKKGKK